MAHPMILPQHRELCREAIAHHLDGAEMHAQMRDALPADHVEHRALHRDMAMRSLKHADELHDHLRSMHGHEAPPTGWSARRRPSWKTKDEGADEATDELCREFRRVTAAVGRLPSPSAASPARCSRSATPAGRVELSALRDNAAELVNLRRSQSDADARLALQRCDDLIARHSAPGPQCVITPAVEREMRGIDPPPASRRAWAGGARTRSATTSPSACRAAPSPTSPARASQPVNAAAAQFASAGAQALAHPGTFAVCSCPRRSRPPPSRG